MRTMSELAVYVVHVRENNAERKAYITQHLESFGMNAQFMLEGDMIDLDDALLDKYFRGDFKKVSPEASCTTKHFNIAQRIADGDAPYALVLEDDIKLDKHFPQLYNQILDELENRPEIFDGNFLISLENNNRFVPKSEEVENQMLYPRKHGRLAGAYILGKKAAQAMMKEVLANKCHKVSDHYHNYLSEQGLISIYWSHPTMAEQGSHNGKMASLIDDKKTGWFRQIVWRIQTWIKVKRRQFR